MSMALAFFVGFAGLVLSLGFAFAIAIRMRPILEKQFGADAGFLLYIGTALIIMGLGMTVVIAMLPYP